MSGLSDYSTQNVLNYITGRTAMPALPSVFCALFTVAPTSDAGTGGTEVGSGSGYVREQVAGPLTAATSAATGTAIVQFSPPIPSWIVVGMYVFDTSRTAIPANTTVSSLTASAVTLSNNVTTNAISSGDTIVFSAFSPASGSTGTEPATTPGLISNNAVITFPQATGNWGTVLAFGLYDASGAGDLLTWDYLGNFNWLPCTISNASPGVITATAHGYSNGGTVVYTTKYGGTQPSFSQANLTGSLTVASATTDTFTVSNAGSGVNTSSTGDGQVRGVGAQSIPNGVTASFSSGTMVITAA